MNICNILTFDRAVNQETGASGRNYPLDLWTGWIRCRCDAYKKLVDVKQLYNRVPRTAWVSWSQLVGVSCSWSSSCSSRQWEPAPDRELAALSDPRLSGPAEWGRGAAIIQRNLGSICCSLFPSQTHLSHIILSQPFRNPFENKVWEVYFSKEVCSFVIIVNYVSAYICIRIVVSRLYNILLQT